MPRNIDSITKKKLLDNVLLSTILEIGDLNQGGKSMNKDHSTGWFPFPDPDWGNETPSAYDIAVARAPTPPPSVSPYSPPFHS